MRIFTTIDSTNKMESHKETMISIMCNLNYARFTMNLFLERRATGCLNQEEKIMSFLLSLSSIYEAWKKFDTIKKHIYPSSNNTQSLQNAWNYLNQKEVNLYKERLFNYIRNRSTFHVDEEVVSSFFEDQELPIEVVLWEESSGTINSPLAFSIVSDWTIKQFNDPILSVALTIGNVLNALNHINMVILTEWLGGTIEK